MNKVKWQDPTDGGWRTGMLISEACHEDDIDIWANEATSFGLERVLRLVKESGDGKLTWVRHGLLSEWESREKWEKSA